MVIGLARFDLRIREARSLKDKRSVVRSLVAGLRQTFNCAVGEVDYQDVHQRAALAVAVVADRPFHARRMLGEIRRRVETHPGAEVLAATVDLLAPE